VRVVLAAGLASFAGSLEVDPAVLRPVGRLSGAQYGLLGEIRAIPRPGSSGPQTSSIPTG